MKKKICYIISEVDESHQLEAMVKFISNLEYEISVILINNHKPRLFDVFKEQNLDVRFIKFSSKKDIIFIFYKIYILLGEIKPDIVHTHLFYATVAGLLAAKTRGIKNRIHTRHHSNGAHVYYPSAVRYDKFCNYLSSHLIAISENVANILINKEHVSASKISIINHGFDFETFSVEESAVEKIKAKYSLDSHQPVIGVISRYDHWKGVQYIIPAFYKLLNDYPNAKLVLANARGNYANEINKLLNEYLPEQSFTAIPFERDIFPLYKNFDIFVHVPISPEFEAYGQVYVEALAMQIPSIFTLSGIANDFIKDKKNALIVPYCDSESIYTAITTLLDNFDMREQITKQGKADVLNRFDIRKMAKELDMLYRKI